MLAGSPCFELGSVCNSVAETVQTHRACMRQGQRGLERLTASCPSDGCVWINRDQIVPLNPERKKGRDDPV